MSPNQRILSLAFTNSIGFSATTAMALWITVIDQHLSVPSWWGSVVGAMQLAAAALANLLAPYLFRRLGCEDLSKYAGVAAMVCGAMMAVSLHPLLFAAGAIGLGASLGMLLSGTNALLSRSHHVQSNYATAQICEVTFAAIFYVVAGAIIEPLGLPSVFVLISALGLVAFLVMHRLSLVEKSPREAPGVALAAHIDWRIPVAAAAFICFFIGQSAFYQHQIAIGSEVGISPADMSRLMAVATVGGLAGAVVSKLLGVRFGTMRPLIVTTALLAVVLVVTVRSDSPAIFAMCAITVQALTMATVPYAFAIFAGLDATGRFPSRGPALLLMGVAGGPLLAESFLRLGGYTMVGIAGAALVLLSGLLFIVGTRGLPAIRKMPEMEMVVPPS